MRSLPFAVSTLGVTATASPGLKPFDNFVTFGDSYTDNGRAAYYFANGNQPPPPGTLPPASNVTASGGLAWGQFVQQYSGAAYFDYAVSGATCSNKVTPHFYAAANAFFPSVVEDQLPSFVADVQYETLYANRTADNTVYALWIGTNDLGNDGFLLDKQVAGTNITTYIDCVWSVFDTIYATGGRRFVLLGSAPLQLAPLYASQSAGGIGDNMFWPNKTAYNDTEYQHKMLEYTQLVDRVFDYGAPFELLVKKRWPGATFDILDVNSVMTEIHDNPSAYLEAPANVTGWYHDCNIEGTECVDAANSLDTFMWYDSLHPSERTSSVIAREFLGALAGNSSYGTHYGW